MTSRDRVQVMARRLIIAAAKLQPQSETRPQQQAMRPDSAPS
jgi:hypothetical protein